ncbi:MAG TPA: hypothetical protein VGH13_20415, partial [Xanthobacteraceae bacterium]
VAGTSIALEEVEPTFGQDLNGDGVTGLYAAPNTTLVISQALSSASGAATIGAGATLELEAADSSSVTFDAATGTLILDHSNLFTAQVIGFTGSSVSPNPSNSDVIDIRDVANASVTKQYDGSSGVLTVSDAEHDTANISFTGSYTLASFTLSSDGGVGTYVIDPPVTQGVPTGASSFDTSAVKTSSAVSMPPQRGASASGDAKSSAATLVQSFDAAFAGARPAGTRIIASLSPLTVSQTDASQSLAQTAASSNAASAGDTISYGTAFSRHPESNQAIDSAANLGLTGAVADRNNNVATTASVAREVVSPGEVIRAIKASEIAIKRVDAAADAGKAGSRVWLFDEVQGTFVAPAPEPLTIVIERNKTASPLGYSAEELGLVATAAMISSEPSWLGSIRQFGRKAARMVQHGAKWIQ